LLGCPAKIRRAVPGVCPVWPGMGLVTESARIRRLLVEGGGRPEEPDPHADADPRTEPAG